MPVYANDSRRPRSAVALAPALAALFCALGCGGGHPPPASLPAPVTAEIQPSGTEVMVALAGGATLLLQVPPGAVASAVSVTFTPIDTPPRALAAVRVTPAGIRFAVPATLTVTLAPGAALPADGALALVESARPLYLPSRVDAGARTLQAGVSVLGLGDAAGAAPAPAGSGAALTAAVTGQVVDLFAESVTLEDRIDAAQTFIQEVKDLGSIPAADLAQTAMLAVFQLQGPAQDPVHALTAAWRDAVCTQALGAEIDFTVFVYLTVEDFEVAAKPMIDWFRIHQAREAVLDGQPSGDDPAFRGCAPNAPDPLARIREKTPQFLEIARGEIDTIDATTVLGFDALVNKAIEVASVAGTLSIDDQFQDLVDAATDLARGAFDRLRAAAYQRCREDGALHLQRRLIDLAIAGMPALVAYPVSAVIQDINECMLALIPEVVDLDSMVVIGQGAIGGGQTPDTARRAETVVLGTRSKLVLGGMAHALRCPVSNALNTEWLELRMGTMVVASIDPGSGDYLASPFERTSDQLRAIAGLAQDQTGNLDLVIRRGGETCGQEFFVQAGNFDFGTLTVRLSASPNIFAGSYRGTGNGIATRTDGEMFPEVSEFTVTIQPGGALTSSGTVTRNIFGLPPGPVAYTATGQVETSGAAVESGTAGSGMAACPFTYTGTFQMMGAIASGRGEYHATCPDGTVSSGTWVCSSAAGGGGGTD